MRRSGWTPSIVPNGSDRNVYLVVDCDSSGHRCVWREADGEETALETVITDLISGQYRVVAFNTFEHWAEDISGDVAREVRRRADLAHNYLIPGVEEFVNRHVGATKALSCSLSASVQDLRIWRMCVTPDYLSRAGDKSSLFFDFDPSPTPCAGDCCSVSGFGWVGPFCLSSTNTGCRFISFPPFSVSTSKTTFCSAKRKAAAPEWTTRTSHASGYGPFPTAVA
jgi:hypothetical protein